MSDYVSRKAVLMWLQGMLDGIDIKRPENAEQERIIGLIKDPIRGAMKFTTEMSGLTLQFTEPQDRENKGKKKQQEEKMTELQEMMCDRYCMYSRSNTINQEELDEHCDNCEMVELWNMINDAKDTNVPTIGDKIRESNESLAEFIENMECDFCNLRKDDILAYLNKPAESEE